MSDDAIPARLLSRIDETPDPLFYRQPRFVTHIDDATIAAITQVYRERLPDDGRVLDLMSSWISHLPEDIRYARVAGLGLNAEELAANSRLSDWIVHDLNADPSLPYPDRTFDALLIAVSVQYLTHPVQVFREMHRVLRPGGEALVAVSHRVFPTKAVALFRSLPPAERPRAVAGYFWRAGGYDEPLCLDRSPKGAQPSDPLWMVVSKRLSR